MEKTRSRNKLIEYLVTFEDGSQQTITITNGMILTGESTESIARKRQKQGELRAGNIISVLPRKPLAKEVDIRAAAHFYLRHSKQLDLDKVNQDYRADVKRFRVL